MTTIKCKHLYAVCYMNFGNRCDYCDFNEWGGYGQDCEYYASKHDIYITSKDDKRIDVNETCGYMGFRERFFEYSVKNYEYDDNGLTIGKTFIPAGAITYLEIDGEKIIGGDK